MDSVQTFPGRGQWYRRRKISCMPCINGHRSSKCDHARKRNMYYVRKAGRPVTRCQHPPCSVPGCDGKSTASVARLGANVPVDCCAHVQCNRHAGYELAYAAPAVHENAGPQRRNRGRTYPRHTHAAALPSPGSVLTSPGSVLPSPGLVLPSPGPMAPAPMSSMAPASMGSIYLAPAPAPMAPVLMGSAYPEAVGSTYPEAVGSAYPTPVGSTYPEAAGLTYPDSVGLTYPDSVGSTYPDPVGSTYPDPVGLMYQANSGVMGSINPSLILGNGYQMGPGNAGLVYNAGYDTPPMLAGNNLVRHQVGLDPMALDNANTLPMDDSCCAREKYVQRRSAAQAPDMADVEHRARHGDYDDDQRPTKRRRGEVESRSPDRSEAQSQTRGHGERHSSYHGHDKRRSRSPNAERHEDSSRRRRHHHSAEDTEPVRHDPTDHQSRRRHRSSPKRPSHRSPVLLPFSARALSKADLDVFRPLLARYLDLQKSKFMADMDEREVRGRWKSFVAKWNEGTLAEGWYDPELFEETRQSGLWDDRLEEHNAPPLDSHCASRKPGTADSGEEDEDDYGPVLPGRRNQDGNAGKQGAGVPNLQDLEVRREMNEEERLDRIAQLRLERKADRSEQKARLDELAPRAEAGTRERQLEKKKEINEKMKGFRERSPGAAEVNDGELMGGGDSFDEIKRMKASAERKKTEKEIRREEILRAKNEEREERLREYREKEDRAMVMLKELAKQRFG
ncbi:RNA helicase-like protein [Seiridium cupressi]